MQPKTPEKRNEIATRDAELRQKFADVQKKDEPCWPAKFARDNDIHKVDLNRYHRKLYQEISEYAFERNPEKMRGFTAGPDSKVTRRKENREREFREQYEVMSEEVRALRAKLEETTKQLAAGTQRAEVAERRAWRLERALDAILLRASDYNKELVQDLDAVIQKIALDPGDEYARQVQAMVQSIIDREQRRP